MVTVNEVRKLAERLSKAEALVAEGAVFPVSGLDGYAVVRNGDSSSMYLVRSGLARSTAPALISSTGEAGQPCKHIIAGLVFRAQVKTYAVCQELIH